MKNINIDDNTNLEKILENEELPISVNNKLVVISYDEYIKNLKIIMPEKAKKIEEELLKYQFKHFSNLFTIDIIDKLRLELIKIFSKNNLKLEDFKDKFILNQIISTRGYERALENVLESEFFKEEFFDWYNKLEYYDSDSFDALIETKLFIREE